MMSQSETPSWQQPIDAGLHIPLENAAPDPLPESSSATPQPTIEKQPLAKQVPTVDNSANDDLDAALFDLMTRLLMAPDTETARRFAGHLIAEYLDADFVVIGQAIKGATPCKIAVVAGPVPPAELRHTDIEAALSETVATARTHRASPQTHEGDLRAASRTLDGLAHRNLYNFVGGHREIVSVPLLNTADQPIGAIMTVVVLTQPSSKTLDLARRLQFLERVAVPVADLFSILDKAKPNLWDRCSEKVRQAMEGQRRQWLIFGCLLFTVLCLVPIRYPVRADVTLEPKTRRFISAPMDARLKVAHVYPGKTVEKGELLLTLDTDDRVSRKNALQAKSDQAKSQRRGYLAAGDAGDAEMSRLQAAELSSEIEQLDRLIQRAKIHSPIQGVVLGKDLKPMEGAPLQIGQVLFEIAPLERLIAKLEIPPDQFRHVESGQDVTLSLDAAGRVSGFQIQRIHPRAEPNDQGHYHFAARVIVENTDANLRPGMRGVATVYADRRPLVWCVFQRLWQRIRNWS